MKSYPLVATASWEVDPNAAYSVTIENAGTGASGAGNYAKDATVNLDAGTRAGYTFAGWTVTSGTATLADASSAQTTFSMPAENVTVTASWTQNARTLTIKGLPSGDKTETHMAGEQVTVHAGTKPGHTFDCWAVVSGTVTLANAASAETSFTMPDADVTLLAVWTPVPENGVITLCLDELSGPLTIDAQGYRCGEPGNYRHSFTGSYILTQSNPAAATANTVTVSGKSDFKVTIRNVNIASSDRAALLVDEDTKLTLTLKGDNTLKGGAGHAGLELKATNRIPETAVTINGTDQDSLTAAGGDYGAGIGGAGPVCYNSVTIHGGVITATGGKGAAGIGSGNTYAPGNSGAAPGPGHSDDITINGGTVTATGTADSSLTYPSGALLGAAGIGAGYGAASGDQKGPYSLITITGGDVTATGVGKAPAIGGTYTGMITISGGTVTTHRGDNQSTAEIGKHPDASGGVCQVRLSDWQGTKAGDAQIFVSGPNAISEKPAAPTGTDNDYWNAIVYEGNSGQLYCSNYNSTQTMELDSLTVPAGKTLSIPRGVHLKLPADGLHYDGAFFAGEGRVLLGEIYHYAKQDGALAPCEAMLIDSNGVTTTGIFNTLQDIITGTIGNDGKTPWLTYSGHKIRLLTDVDYPADLSLAGTRCTGVELDLNGKTLDMGGHTILTDVESSTVAESNAFTISDSAGGGKITGNSAAPLVRSTDGRLVIAGGAMENSGTGPAVQIENTSKVQLSGGSFSRVTVTANTGYTPAPLNSLLSGGTAFYDRANDLWISPASKKAELSGVSVRTAPAGLLPVTVEHEVGASTASIGGLTAAGGASYQWFARDEAGSGAEAVANATGVTLYLNNGTLEAGAWYVSCQVTAGGVTVLTDEILVNAVEPDVLTSLDDTVYTYDGTACRPNVRVSAKNGTVLLEGTDYTLSYADNTKAGTAKVTITGKGTTSQNTFDPVVLTFQIDPAALTIQAKDQTVAGSGAPQSGAGQAEAAGLIAGDRLDAVTLSQNEDRTQVVASAAVIRNAAGEDVTGCYRITYLPGALTVTGGGSGGSSGGGTTVVRHPDGSTTTTRRDSQTGAVSETTAYPDGSATVSVTQKDGSTGTAEISAAGQVTAQVALSQEAAAGTGAVPLPLPALEARAELEQAPTVTIAAPAAGQVLVEVPVSNVTSGTVAVLVRPDGTTQVLRQTIPGETGVTVAVEAGATVKIVQGGRQFADVAETDWAADAVAFATSRELFQGVSETRFAPDQPMTRAMLMTALARLDGENPAGGSEWYAGGVQWAVSGGISDGTAPMADISREQLVVMLYRYAGSPAAAEQDLAFRDADAVSDYARAAMNWAVSQGILRGMGNGLLAPQGPATRAQTAQILENYMRTLA